MGAGPDLDDGLELLLSSPREKVRTQLEYLATRRPVTGWTRELATDNAGSPLPCGPITTPSSRPTGARSAGHLVTDRARRVQERSGHGIDRAVQPAPGVRWNPPVLEASTSGCTTSELALRCGVSLAAAGRQATVLRDAGLIMTRREGGAVRHEVTPLGLNLLNGLALTA